MIIVQCIALRASIVSAMAVVFRCP